MKTQIFHLEGVAQWESQPLPFFYTPDIHRIAFLIARI
jgi:hypothetical protein